MVGELSATHTSNAHDLCERSIKLIGGAEDALRTEIETGREEHDPLWTAREKLEYLSNYLEVSSSLIRVPYTLWCPGKLLDTTMNDCNLFCKHGD